MATLITGVIVAVIIFTAARQLYRDKKNGKSLCGENVHAVLTDVPAMER